MNLLIKHKIWIGFSLILLLLVGTTAVSISNLNGTKTIVNHVVIDSQPMLIASQGLSTHLSHAHASLGEFLLTRADKSRQGFQNSMYEASESINTMSEFSLVKNSDVYQAHINSFRTGLSQYQSYENRMIKLSKNVMDNFPAFQFASNHLINVSGEFLGLMGQMILSEDGEELSEERVIWLNEMHNIRYGFIKLMSTVRIYMQSPEADSLSNMNLESDTMLSSVKKMLNEDYQDLYTFEQEESVDKAVAMVAHYVKNLKKLIEINQSDKRRVDVYLYDKEMTPILKSINDELDALVEELVVNNELQGKGLLEQVESASIFQLSLALIGIVLGVVIAFVISKIVTIPLAQTVSALQDLAQGEGDLTKRLDVKGHDEIGQLSQAFNEFSQKVQGLVTDVAESATQLTQSASQMDDATSSTQSDIVNQNNQIDMVVQEIESMNIKIQSVVGHTNQAAALAEETNNNASKGQQVVNESASSSEQLALDVDRASQVINELENDVETIGGVLDVIRGIAEQTNLLALNAAIEAARAGEQGRGFAVVADEVRTLASRTGESTEEIQKMIERLQTGSKQAVQVMQQGKVKADEGLGLANQAGESLDSIYSAVQGMLDMNREIASGTEEQGKSAQQVNQNINAIKTISDKTSQSAQSMASTSSNVMLLALQLQTLLGQFKI